MKYSRSARIGRLRVWVAGEGDERKLYPTFGVLNTQPTEWPGVFVEDGELTVYVAWWIFEVSLVLVVRRAQCVFGKPGSVRGGIRREDERNGV